MWVPYLCHCVLSLQKFVLYVPGSSVPLSLRLGLLVIDEEGTRTEI